MKRLFLGLLVLSLAACAAIPAPNYQTAQNSSFTEANYEAADKLMAGAAQGIDKKIPLLVATMVNIDQLEQSSRFGRLVSEQVASRLTQIGFGVVEMKLRDSVYIREGAGELLLSRDVRDLSKSHNAQFVVVGNYAVASGYVYLTLKAISVSDNRVISAVNYTLPLTANTISLLAPRLLQ